MDDLNIAPIQKTLPNGDLVEIIQEGQRWATAYWKPMLEDQDYTNHWYLYFDSFVAAKKNMIGGTNSWERNNG